MLVISREIILNGFFAYKISFLWFMFFTCRHKTLIWVVRLFDVWPNTRDDDLLVTHWTGNSAEEFEILVVSQNHTHNSLRGYNAKLRHPPVLTYLFLILGVRIQTHYLAKEYRILGKCYKFQYIWWQYDDDTQVNSIVIHCA